MSRCREIGVKVRRSDHRIPYVARYELNKALKKNDIDRKEFYDAGHLAELNVNGITCYLWWDIEARLSRVMKTAEEKEQDEFFSFLEGKSDTDNK